MVVPTGTHVMSSMKAVVAAAAVVAAVAAGRYALPVRIRTFCQILRHLTHGTHLLVMKGVCMFYPIPLWDRLYPAVVRLAG